MFRTLAGAAVALGAGASADVVEYTFTLTGCKENPPVLTTGHGTATVVLDTDTGEVTINGSYETMSSDVVAAHIHGLADADQNGGVVLGLQHDGGTEGTISGTGVLSDLHVQGMLDGLTYINVHTVNNGPGEIRGQIVAECLGDFDKDGAKNILDFVAFQAAFLANACEADVNHDGATNILDFVAFQANFEIPCD